MKKVLITGITGFAGSHLADLLVNEGTSTVAGTHVSDRHLKNLEGIKDKVQLFSVNLLDSEKTAAIIGEFKPDVVYHLAASTFVGDSFKKPAEFIANNVTAQVNVHEAIRQHGLTDTKIIVISSAHNYGLVRPEDLPIDEETPFRPDNPYSVSKITQDYVGLTYFLAYKQHTVRLRPFNHIGPRLSPDISLSRFAKKIAEIEKGLDKPVLTVGNLESKRDFTDVRDMVKAYVQAAEKCIDGEAYNIGTGTSHTMRDVLDMLITLASVKIEVQSDPTLFRPSDIPELRCDASKFKQATGWEPTIPLEQTLKDLLAYWREIV